MLSLLLLTGVTQASTYVSWSELMNTSAFQPGDCLTVGADILLDLDDDATFELLEIQASGAVQILSPNIALEASEIAISGKLLVGKDADTEVISEVDGVEIRLMGLTGGCNQWTLSEAPSGYALSPSGALASTRPRTIFVNDGGALEVYGKDSGTPWTTLTSSSTTGTYAGEPYTRIDVADDTGWQIGADIALAGTGFGRFDSERFSLGSGGGGTWYLPGTASYEHFADPAGAYGPSVAGEVARLSRSVKIYTPTAELGAIDSRRADCSGGEDPNPDLAYLEFDGAEIHVGCGMDADSYCRITPTLKLTDVEVFNAGKFDRMRQYPIHTHMLGDATGKVELRRVAVHTSSNRGIVIHTTQGAILEDNVVYDVVGHGYYLEEDESGYRRTSGNTLKDNLAMQIHGCKPSGGQESSSEDVSEEHDAHASGFFFTDPANVFVGNHAAGAKSAGFWWNGGVNMPNENLCGDAFQIPGTPLERTPIEYPDDYDEPNASPDTKPDCYGAFDSNVAHSASYGLWADNHKTMYVRYTNFTAYKNNIAGMRTRNHGVTEVLDYRASDNPTGLWPGSHATHSTRQPTLLMMDAEIWGESNRPIAEYPPDELGGVCMPFYGVEIYEGGLYIANSAFSGYDGSDPSIGARAAFGRHQTFPFYTDDPDNRIDNVSFINGSTPLYFDLPSDDTRDPAVRLSNNGTCNPMGTVDGASGFASVMLHDVDGSIASIPHATLVPDNPLLLDQSAATPPAGFSRPSGASYWVADPSMYRYGQLFVQWCAERTNSRECDAVDSDGIARQSFDWDIEGGANLYDVIKYTTFTDAHGNEVRSAPSHEGAHASSGINVLTNSAIQVEFYDDSQLPLSATDFDQVRLMQVHLRSADDGEALVASLAVPEAPHCMAWIEGRGRDGVVVQTVHTDTDPLCTGTALACGYSYSTGFLDLYLEATTSDVGDTDVSVLVSFDPAIDCPLP